MSWGLGLSTNTPPQIKYLAQLYNISPEYAMSVYSLLQDPGLDFAEVEDHAETAHLWYKEAKFRPTGEKLVGFTPKTQTYNIPA